MATLTGYICGQQHDIHNQENSLGNYEGSPTSSQDFMYFGPLTAKK